MSQTAEGPGWWQATDGNWYPPEQHPQYQTPAPPPPQAPPPLPQAWQAPSTTYQPAIQRPLGKDRSPASVLGLSIVTLGIYYVSCSWMTVRPRPFRLSLRYSCIYFSESVTRCT